ncbi:site-2 protease family protein [Stieleria mannarensis]|uniref:site-2 protease family protein n=1 Tax=Stieleria mannarensis TaxID=2755585 RepID=UPI001604077C|nr:site-2 protease family protein [Rhodopirellula sp. JC639]
MFGSIRLGRLAGIDLKMHWTFLLLIAWVGGSALVGTGTLTAAAANIALVLCVFACVVAHEYGHALTARRYGIPTEDITLLPIGGVARLQSIPEKPLQELAVAIAGPLVNVAIAVVIGAGLLLSSHNAFSAEFFNPAGGIGAFLRSLLVINIALVVFNLIPAFPMDGGRMLRAVLALKMNRVKATDIAASVGQFLAFGIGFLGLYGNPFLILIAVFVYFGARGEALQVRTSALLSDLPVRAAMIAQMRTANADDRLAQLREMLLDGAQQDFPVLDDDGKPVGIIFRSQIIRGLKEGLEDAAVQTQMTPLEAAMTEPSVGLRDAMQQMQSLDLTALLVLNGDRLVGLLTRENIAELLMFRESDPDYAPTGRQTTEIIA